MIWSLYRIQSTSPWRSLKKQQYSTGCTAIQSYCDSQFLLKMIVLRDVLLEMSMFKETIWQCFLRWEAWVGAEAGSLGRVLCHLQRRSFFFLPFIMFFENLWGSRALRIERQASSSFHCCLPYNCCFSAKLVKSHVKQICTVLTVLQASSLLVHLCFLRAQFYLPFEGDSSPWAVLVCGNGRSSDSPFSPMEMLVRKIHI